MFEPLLPPEVFNQGYRHVKRLAHEWKLFAKFKKFFFYYEQFWIREVSFRIPEELLFNGTEMTSA